MVFSSMIFLWIFLPSVILLYRIVGRKYRNLLLLLCSIFFYAWGEPKYVLLLLLSIVINYYSGILLEWFWGRKNIQIVILILNIIANLSVLIYFKYFNFICTFFRKIFCNEALQIHEIVLPIGISFFTFQAMSYIIDLYRKKYHVQKNFVHLALYIFFFPQLIAGPIVIANLN